MRITNRELNRYRKELDKRSLNAKAYVLARLRSEAKDLSNVADARNATIEIIRDALGMYGDEAQVVASTLFDEICEAEGIKASSEIFDNVIDDELMQKKVRYYAEKIEDDWQGYEKSNADLITYYVKRSAYENIIRNCKKNHVRYARVPSGRETCPFCFMLSSRGFAYLTKETAEMHGLHPHCDCIVVPGKDGKTKISGYDPDGMAKRFRQCQNTVGVKTVNKLNRKQVFKEIETRDWEWLYTGKTPEVSYATNTLKHSIEQKTPWEKRTAERLAKHGITPNFQIDYKYIKENGAKTRKGLADFKNGVEIKTPMSSKNPYGATINYFNNTVNKDGVTRLVIDNMESNFTDDEILEAVKNISKNYKFNFVISVLSKKDKLINIK